MNHWLKFIQLPIKGRYFQLLILLSDECCSRAGTYTYLHYRVNVIESPESSICILLCHLNIIWGFKGVLLNCQFVTKEGFLHIFVLLKSPSRVSKKWPYLTSHMSRIEKKLHIHNVNYFLSRCSSPKKVHFALQNAPKWLATKNCLQQFLVGTQVNFGWGCASWAIKPLPYSRPC